MGSLRPLFRHLLLRLLQLVRHLLELLRGIVRLLGGTLILALVRLLLGLLHLLLRLLQRLSRFLNARSRVLFVDLAQSLLEPLHLRFQLLGARLEVLLLLGTQLRIVLLSHGVGQSFLLTRKLLGLAGRRAEVLLHRGPPKSLQRLLESLAELLLLLR